MIESSIADSRSGSRLGPQADSAWKPLRFFIDLIFSKTSSASLRLPVARAVRMYSNSN